MAATSTAAFDFSRAEDDILKLTVDKTTYEIHNDGKIMDGATEITAATHKDVFKQVNKEAAKAAENFVATKATDTVQVSLVKSVIDSKKAEAEFDKLRKIATATEALETKIKALPSNVVATEAQLKELRLIMAKAPEAKNILDVDSYNRLHIEKVKIAGKPDVALIDGAALEASVNKLTGAAKDLEKMALDGTATEEAVRKPLP